MGGRGVARIAVAGLAPRRRSLLAQLREKVAVDRARHFNPRAAVLFGSVLGERADDAVGRAGIESDGAQPACASRTSAVGICAAAALRSARPRCGSRRRCRGRSARVGHGRRCGSGGGAEGAGAAVVPVCTLSAEGAADEVSATTCDTRGRCGGPFTRQPTTCRSRSHRFRCLPPAGAPREAGLARCRRRRARRG